MTLTQENLFTPNNHSQYLIGWKPVSRETESQLKELLQSFYPIREIAKIEQVDEWERMSNNFRVSCLHGGSKEVLLLRKHIAINDPEKLSLIENISQLLISSGLPTPETINSRQNQAYVLVDGNYWQVFKYIEGDHFRGTEPELLEAAKYIALFHKALSQSNLPIPSNRPYPWTREEWNKIFNLTSAGKNETDQIIINHWPLIEAAIERAETLQHTSLNTGVQPIHRDLHPHNTIFKDSSLKALLDFADVSLGERARDIGNACHRFVRQYIVFQEKPWQEIVRTGLELFLKQYHKHFPIPKDELASVPLFMYDELLGKLYYNLKMAYLDNDDRFITGGQPKKMLTLLTEAHILETELTKITL